LGHLILAAEALHQLELARLLWVLTADPPHKTHRVITPLADRLAMVDAAISDNPAFELSRVEIDRPGPHYAIETVELLRERFPSDELVYLLGGDSLGGLPVSWHRPRDFVAACDLLGVMYRPGDSVDLARLETQIPGLTQKVRLIDAPLLEISSRELRRRIAMREPYRYYLPPAVIQVIATRGLYQTPDMPLRTA
jgi:nicotinate-nucleotide adenylyltransferase